MKVLAKVAIGNIFFPILIEENDQGKIIFHGVRSRDNFIYSYSFQTETLSCLYSVFHEDYRDMTLIDLQKAIKRMSYRLRLLARQEDKKSEHIT